MNRIGLSLVLVLFGPLYAQAGITVSPINLQTGDGIGYWVQTYPYPLTDGGPFRWTLEYVSDSPVRLNPPAQWTQFYTFCTEMDQTIQSPLYVETVQSAKDYFSVRSRVQPPDYTGAWLFLKWADNDAAFIDHDNSFDSNVVQIGIWRSLGYSPPSGSSWAEELQILDDPVAGWLRQMPSNWQPGEDVRVLVFGNSQDLMFLAPGTNEGVPEPATLIIWSLLGALGVALGWRRRKRAA
jgi:hypothetical protein